MNDAIKTLQKMTSTVTKERFPILFLSPIEQMALTKAKKMSGKTKSIK